MKSTILTLDMISIREHGSLDSIAANQAPFSLANTFRQLRSGSSDALCGFRVANGRTAEQISILSREMLHVLIADGKAAILGDAPSARQQQSCGGHTLMNVSFADLSDEAVIDRSRWLGEIGKHVLVSPVLLSQASH